MNRYQSGLQIKGIPKLAMLPALSQRQLLAPKQRFTIRSCSIRTTKADTTRVSSGTPDTPPLKSQLSPTNPLPYISASSCAIYCTRSHKFIFQKKDCSIAEIASLTKIMTCYACIKLCKERKISIECPVTISAKSVKITGTSAGLTENSKLTVRSLLYALMLPSGNDAAIALAEYFGEMLATTTKPMKVFVQHMNKIAQELNLTCTSFQNPHGLCYKRNLSSARDVASLTALALRESIFKEIVSCKIYRAEVKLSTGDSDWLIWKNTNKLLGEGFEGVKTGVTNIAGPCLCAFGDGFIIVLINCRSQDTRWVEAKKLKEWAILHSA